MTPKPKSVNRHAHLTGAMLALVSITVGCGGPDNISAATTTVDGQFCEAMAQLIVLLGPTDESSPDQTKATFESAAVWFEQANRTAPRALASDFAAYTAAYDEYAHFLSTVGYNLDVVFSTPEGKQLAIDTSHTLTPAIVQHVVGECGLSFGDEAREPSTS